MLDGHRTRTKKPWAVFSRLDDRADALQAIRNASLFLGALAGFFTVDLFKGEKLVATGHSFPPATFALMIVHIIVFGFGAFFLRRFNSRVVAILLFCVCLKTGIETAWWISNGHQQALVSVRNVILLLALWGSVRAIEATFKLRERFAEGDATRAK